MVSGARSITLYDACHPPLVEGYHLPHPSSLLLNDQLTVYSTVNFLVPRLSVNYSA